METPHDVGIAHVIDEGNGQLTVYVCASVEHGMPKGILAVHRHARRLVVGPAVILKVDQKARTSKTNVIVFGDEKGTVHVLPPDAEERLVVRSGTIGLGQQ
jgi:hypothetical protein